MNFKNFYNLINPYPEIGCLEINDAHLRFVSLKGGKAKFISMKLPPGAVEGGKIKDVNLFVSAVSNFHSQFGSRNDKKYVIANISDLNIYTEMFSLPKSSEVNLENAVKLNLRMISPIDFDNAYSDWQLLKEKISEDTSHQLEFLGAFAPKQTIDDFENALSKSGFNVVAVEFPCLSLVRAFKKLGEGFSDDKNYILMRVGSDGLGFGFIKRGELYFSHFISWISVYGDQHKISFDEMGKTIISEARKVLSFYESHSNAAIDGVILSSSILTAEISKIISDNFPTLPVKVMVLKGFKNLEPSWFSAVGSALRGAMIRSDDTIISLASSGTEEKFKIYQISAFIRIWRNIILSFLAAITIFFFGLDFIIVKNFTVLEEEAKNISIVPEFLKIGELQKEIDAFNRKTDLIYHAHSQKSKWSSFFNQINRLAGKDIGIKRILIQSADSPILLVGEADSENKIIAFKESLQSQSQFSNINLQLSNVSKNTEGQISFGITFELKK